MQNIEILFLSVAFSIAVFLLLREVFCWYFKINQRISLLSDIKDELVKANRKDADLTSKQGAGTVKCEVISKNVTGSGGSGSGSFTREEYEKAKSESFWRPE
jgi:hypothetical protein